MSDILAIIIALVLLSLVVGAVRGHTLADTARIIWWAWTHPKRALFGPYDDENGPFPDGK